MTCDTHHKEMAGTFCFDCWREEKERERKALVVTLTAALDAGRIIRESNGGSNTIEWRLRAGFCETRHNARDWSHGWGHYNISGAEIAEHLSQRTGLGMTHTVHDDELPAADRTDHDPRLQDIGEIVKNVYPDKTVLVEDGAVWVRAGKVDYAIVSRTITGQYVKTMNLQTGECSLHRIVR